MCIFVFWFNHGSGVLFTWYTHYIPHTSHLSHITSLTHHIPHTSHPSHIISLTHHIPHTLHTRDQKTFTLKTTCGMVPFHWWTLIRLTDTQCCICGSPNYQHNWFTTVRDALQPTVRTNKIANRGIWAPEPVSLGTRLVRTWRHSTFSGRETLCCGYSCKYICVLKFQGWLQPHNYFNSRFWGLLLLSYSIMLPTHTTLEWRRRHKYTTLPTPHPTKQALNKNP